MFGIKNRKARQKLLVFYKRKGIIPMAFFQWLQKLKERERERQRELNETQLGNVFKGEDKQRSRALQAFYPEFPIPTSQCRILCCLFPDFINFNFLTSPIFLFFFFSYKNFKTIKLEIATLRSRVILVIPIPIMILYVSQKIYFMVNKNNS